MAMLNNQVVIGHCPALFDYKRLYALQVGIDSK